MALVVEVGLGVDVGAIVSVAGGVIVGVSVALVVEVGLGVSVGPGVLDGATLVPSPPAGIVAGNVAGTATVVSAVAINRGSDTPQLFHLPISTLSVTLSASNGSGSFLCGSGGDDKLKMSNHNLSP